MVSTDVLGIYLGGKVVFTRDTEVSNNSGEKMQFKRGSEREITPTLIYMVANNIVPAKNMKLVLRQLDQLEDSEAVELSRIVMPSHAENGLLSLDRKVYRQGERNGFTIEVSVSKDEKIEHSMVINAGYDIAISEIIKPPFGTRPIITQMAAANQIKAFQWLVSKRLDIFRLIKNHKAVGRHGWGANGRKKD